MILDIDNPLYYEEAFVHAHVKPKYDADCIFMYQIL